MVLDKEIKAQLAQYLNLLESDIVLQTDLGDDDNSRKVKEVRHDTLKRTETSFSDNGVPGAIRQWTMSRRRIR